MLTRRDALHMAALAGVVGAHSPSSMLPPADPDAEFLSAEYLQRQLDRYDAAGVKASGGAGDSATGAWLEGELRDCGFETTTEQRFDVPWFTASQCTLATPQANPVALIPQSVVVQTPPPGIHGRLVLRRNAPGDERCDGAIALLDLPTGKWGDTDQISTSLRACRQAGAAAVVVITNGLSGHAQALNAPGHRPVLDLPVAILAPSDAPPFTEAARRGVDATLMVRGVQGTRSAFNVVGTLRRRAQEWVVVTTPRSGWFHCAGERGPGVAVWLALARLLPRLLPNHSLTFAALSGHEHHGTGTTAFLDAAPGGHQTALFVHLGGNLAVRDWHEVPGRLLPLPTPDPQRFVVGTDADVPKLRAAFAGVSGFEMAYPASVGAIGDYVEILRRGYRRSFAGFAVSRFHHTAVDRLPVMTSGAMVAPVARAFRDAICEILA